jgi:hypothetical protein
VSASELVFEDGTHEAVVEESRGAVDDVKRFGLGIVGSHAARWTEDRTVWKRRPARLTGLSFGPAAEEVANRHSVKPISRVRHTLRTP